MHNTDFCHPILSLATNTPATQNVLFSIGSAFLYYVNHFKLYSSFCASHSKAQKVLHPSKYINNGGGAAARDSLLKK